MRKNFLPNKLKHAVLQFQDGRFAFGQNARYIIFILFVAFLLFPGKIKDKTESVKANSLKLCWDLTECPFMHVSTQLMRLVQVF